MRGAIVVGAILAASSLAMTGPALALPFIGKKPAPQPTAATTPAAAPAAKAAPAAATPKTPAAAPATAGVFDIKGFRSAAFGMTAAQVKAAIAADFGGKARMQEGANPTDGTQFILVALDQLDPGPSPAQVGYVFGATGKTLATVNVIWKTAEQPTEQQRVAIADAGQQLAAYFRAGPAPAKASTGVGTFGTNGLLLYTATDKKNAVVEVLVDGVSYQGAAGDKPVSSPPPTGPATLRVTYSVSPDKPDIKTLKPGSF